MYSVGFQKQNGGCVFIFKRTTSSNVGTKTRILTVIFPYA